MTYTAKPRSALRVTNRDLGGALDLKKVFDFADEAYSQVGKYRETFTLSPEQLNKADFTLNALAWRSIPYGKEKIDEVPDDRRGIYAFSVRPSCDLCPPCGYVLYIGIAGRRSDRSLRARYKDYLQEGQILKRPKIARMIGTWHEVLHFFFSPVENEITSEDLEEMEKELNGALLPPCSDADIEADIKTKRRAF